MEDTELDLETFRRQWREEVSARTRENAHTLKVGAGQDGGLSADKSVSTGSSRPLVANASSSKEDGGRFSGSNSGFDIGDRDTGRTKGQLDRGVGFGGGDPHAPHSALEHYERAVERETQGNLGESLNHYRKAYRLDAAVEKIYKKKHFAGPVSSSQASNPNPLSTPITVPNTAHHSPQGPTSSLSIPELISSFSTISISPVSSPDASSRPSPISMLPSEVLIEILLQVALLDLGIFTRLAQVCKRLAFLVATEERIWKRICCGPEVGFGGMHYSWARDIFGRPLDYDDRISYPSTYLPVSLTPAYPSYLCNIRHRPRIRFNGCYISTVNYIRPGAASVSQVSWNTPVHIVTYYRYLRFFRDGTVISLLSTSEPLEVVPHLTKENLRPSMNGLANAAMGRALRGRWKLSGCPIASLSSDNDGQNDDQEAPPEDDQEGNITIETEGVDASKYMYLMHLSIRNIGGRHHKDDHNGNSSSSLRTNTKLIWRGYWNHNRLTDDWAEFGLRNDRAFYWSRVRSYGTGG